MLNKIFAIFIKNSEDIKSPTVRASYGKFANIVGILLNILLFIIKGIAGLLSGSVAIIADAINNLSDASSNVIGFLGFKLGNRPADEEHPYGHGRYEYVAGLLVAFLIMMIGIELLKSGIDKILNPTEISFSILAIVIMVVAIFVKLYMMIFNRIIAKKISSQTLYATATDSRNDVISTSVVLASTIFSIFSSFSIDGYMTVIVSLIILISGVKVVIDTISPLLGKVPDKEIVIELKEMIMSYDGVLGIHDLMVHDYGSGRLFASVHVEMSAKEDPFKSHETIDTIEKDVLEKLNLNLVIHYDPIADDDKMICELKECISCGIKNLDNRLSIHDLRIVYGPQRDIAIFDMVIPFDKNLNEKQLKIEVSKIVKEKYPSFDCNITIDREYSKH